MKWVKHDTDANQDAKLQNVLLDYGLEGYGLYWYCIELIASKVDKDNITFELEHDARIIARNVGSSAQKVTEIMKYFVELGLFECSNNVITCLKLAKRLDKSMTSNPQMRGIIAGLNANKTQLDGYVYFIGKSKNRKLLEVKIGRSKNPSARVAELRKAPENKNFALEIMATIKSDDCVSLETEYHRKYSDSVIVNEWFRPTVELINEVENLRHDVVSQNSDYVMQDQIRLDQIRLEETTLSGSEPETVNSKSEAVEVLSYLNQICGSNFKPTTQSHLKNINARLSDGATVEECKMVIDFKFNQWKGKEQAQYLRPSTLFVPKNFDGYLIAAKTAKPQRNVNDIGRDFAAPANWSK